MQLTHRRVLTTLALGLAAVLTGCLGSPEPYRPYKEGTREPRPDPVEREKEAAELRLETELPIEIARNEADREQSRKALGRIMASIPTNPWVSYERDVYRVLGEVHSKPHLPPGPPERLARNLGLAAAPAAPAAAAEEGGDEEAEEEEEEE
jgi:hypothetical protein